MICFDKFAHADLGLGGKEWWLIYLVIEDDVKLNYIVCSFLSDNGYHVISCKNGLEAFDRILEEPISLIISDIMMPEMDGFEFASEIRKQDKSIPILFMTARDDMSAKQKGYSLGIDDYMVKPIEMDELV